jgi:hypothetical protein
MGFEKYNVVQNLGSTLYYVAGFFMLVGLAMILRVAKNKYKM